MKRLRLPVLPNLEHDLMELVAQIPAGHVTTFGKLAQALGDRTAALWVARTLASHAHSHNCHCHRVVRASGEPLDTARSIPRLLAEGVPLAAGTERRVDLSVNESSFCSTKPLVRLGRWLDRVASHVTETPLHRPPEIVAGLDVAYRIPDEATVAAVIVEVATRSVIWSATAQRPVAFPYIPGYLTFRELPALLDGLRLIEKAGLSLDAVFIDGLGRLHPRRAGVACGFAAVTGLPTIGIAKSLLCGKVDSSEKPPQPIIHQRETLGYAVRNPKRPQPVYVSVGGAISLSQAAELTARLFATRRLPVPTDEADRFSRADFKTGERGA